jgi:tetratricopeptide (TPR) repeat protein
MTENPVHRSKRVRRKFRLRRWILYGLPGLGALIYVVVRVYLPMTLLKDAIASSDKGLYQAEKLVTQAIEQAGGSYPEAEVFRAQLYAASGRGDEALGQFSLIKSPERLPAKQLIDLGLVAMKNQESLLAEKAFLNVSSESEHYPAVLRSLIQIHLEMGRDDTAKSECGLLLELEPNDPTVWQIVGTIALNRKELAEAEEAFRMCLQHSKDGQQLRDTREDLIQILIDQGNVAEARKELSVLAKVSGEFSSRAIIEDAYVHRMEGNPKKGIELLNALADRDDAFQMRVLFLRGLLYADSGQDKEAAADLAAVAKRQPWHKEAHHKLSVILAKLGNMEQADEHRRKADELTDLALELLSASTELAKNPSSSSLRSRVAFLYDQLGQPEQARRIQNLRQTP